MELQGYRGFFSGSLASIYRNVPHSMLAYSFYPHAETFIFHKVQGFDINEDKSSRSFSTRFWAGYITLFCTTLITHPLDTLRVRLSVNHHTIHLPTYFSIHLSLNFI
jgi:solute carrier family 25, member 42